MSDQNNESHNIHILQELAVPVELVLVTEVVSNPIEEKVEEKVEEEKKEEDKLLVLLMKNILQNKGISSITLTKKELDIINAITANNPLFIKNINDDILKIIKDNKIDSYDIHNLIKLIKDFYICFNEEFNVKIDKKDISIVASSLLKYIIHVILTVNKIDSPELIVCCDSLIDISIEMLELQIDFKKKYIFTNFFNCK